MGGGQALGAFPFSLAQPVIIGQQGGRRDSETFLSHPLGSQSDAYRVPAPQRGGHGQNAFRLTVDIITQIGPVTNKKQGLFAGFYKILQAGGRPGVVVQQTGVGFQVKGRGIDLAPPCVQGTEPALTP